MKGYCITHEYAGPSPIIQSRYRTLASARRAYDASWRGFKRLYRSTTTQAIYPCALRYLDDDDEPGDLVLEEDV